MKRVCYCRRCHYWCCMAPQEGGRFAGRAFG